VLERLGVDGPGLVVLTGDGIEQLSDGQLGALLVGVSALIGRPMAQNSDDELVVTVRDMRPADASTARGYLSNGPMLMHTGPTDVAALLCLQASPAGGASLFSSADAVRDVLATDAPAEVDRYHAPWTWDLRGMQAPGATPYVLTPIFGEHAGRISCRFGSLMLREGARAADSLTADAAAALDRFEAVAGRPSLTLRHVLRRGRACGWTTTGCCTGGRSSTTAPLPAGSADSSASGSGGTKGPSARPDSVRSPRRWTGGREHDDSGALGQVIFRR
jgi:hypothetical protein